MSSQTLQGEQAIEDVIAGIFNITKLRKIIEKTPLKPPL